MVTFLGMGQVDVGLMPYTSFMALHDAGAPVKIVAGGVGGINESDANLALASNITFVIRARLSEGVNSLFSIL